MIAELGQTKNKDYGTPVKLLLWALVVLYVVMTLLGTLTSIPALLVSGPLVGVVFALIHGARRYGWSGILTFLVVSLVVSNILENTSILTGFPFGHYHYTNNFGPKLFLVPVVIGPTYFSIGYLAWTLSTILVGDVRRYSSWLQSWIWEQGGGYFGVPLTNYLGWSFTVFLFLFLFALFLRFRKTEHRETWTLPKSYYAQPIVMYATLGF